jgi:hypothetical protein
MNKQDEIQKKINKVKQYSEDTLPDYASYGTLVESTDALKQELVKWTQAKRKASEQYSEAKSCYLYINELLEGQEMDDIELQEKVEQWRDELSVVCDVLKSRLFSIDKIIDSTRSFQSHITSDFNM